MRKKHGEHIDLYWPDEIQFDVVRGHVSAAEFIKATDAAYPCAVEPVTTEDAGPIEQKFAFWGPSNSSLRADGCDRELYLRDEPGRGRFPVTVGYFRSAMGRTAR